MVQNSYQQTIIDLASRIKRAGAVLEHCATADSSNKENSIRYVLEELGDIIEELYLAGIDWDD